MSAEDRLIRTTTVRTEDTMDSGLHAFLIAKHAQRRLAEPREDRPGRVPRSARRLRKRPPLDK